MTITSLLARSLDAAAFALGICGCIASVPPVALGKWERSLADTAARACVEHGGTALVGADRVVSCAPGALSKGREP